MVEELGELKLFKGLEETELNLLRKIASHRVYQPGENIFSEGEQGDKLYVIKEGKIRITQELESGTQPLAILSEGDFFGEISFLDAQPHSATATAMKESTILSISRKDFDEMVENNPREGYTILHCLSAEICSLLRQMDEKFIDMVKFVWEFGAKS
jgi:CRP-like cAMP-binding protein